MKQSRIFCNLPVVLLAVLGIAISFSSDAKADISPEQYEKLKKGAEEVLIVELKSVQEENDNGFKVTVQVEAEIRSVVRSQSSLQPNGKLTFASYYIKDGARQQGFVGPESPPQLKAGEIYKVFLGKELSPISGLLGPAAYGKSFEKVGQAAQGQGAVQGKVAPARALPQARQGPQAGQFAEVIADPANVMDRARVLATIPKGRKLKIYSIRQGWAEVRIPGSTQRGWVEVKDLQVVPATVRNRNQPIAVLSEKQFKELFLTPVEVPKPLTSHADFRITDPNPADKVFEQQNGVRAGTLKFQPGILQRPQQVNPNELVTTVVEIRMEFPTEQAASDYLRLATDALSEGAEKAKGAPRIGDDCQVYGPRNPKVNLQAIAGFEIFGYIYAFRVENIVVKQFVMIVPDANGNLSPDPAVRLAEKAIDRIQEVLANR